MSKHTEARPEMDVSLNIYTGVSPALLPLDITEDIMTEVGRWLYKRAGQGQGGCKRSACSTGIYNTRRPVLNSGKLLLQ